MPTKNTNRHVPFNEVLEALLDESKIFPLLYLSQFSDLEGPDMEALKEIWPRVNADRRATLLEDLEKLAENQTTVLFDNVAIFALQDSSPLVRANAINLLWDSENPRLASRFVEMLKNDPDDSVRAAAAGALGKYVYMGEVDTLPKPTLRHVEDTLLKAMRDSESHDVRRRALESLGYSGRPEVPGLIRKAYVSDTRDWLISALYAISRSADSVWAPEVNRMLRHPDIDVQYEAVRAAGELELESSRRALLAMLENEKIDRELRLQVIWSLAKIGGDEVSEKLEELLDASEDDEEIFFIEEAMDLLTFTEDTSVFRLLDLEENGQEPRMKIDRAAKAPQAGKEDEAFEFEVEEDWDEDQNEDDDIEDTSFSGSQSPGPTRDPRRPRPGRDR